MNTIDAIVKRKSIRSFTDKPVLVDVVDKIIGIAKEAPTGGNMQPWQVAVVQGETKKKLTDAYIKASEAQQKPSPEIAYYPESMPLKYNLRRHLMGTRLYQAKGIQFTQEYIDWPAVIALQKQNYYFFGADVGLLFFIESGLAQGSLLDIGMFMQNIMLAAQEYGLATCSQASWGNYPKIAKYILGIEDDMKLLCGMSLGYPGDVSDDADLERVRENNQEFVRWYS